MNCNKTIDFMRGLKRMCAGVNYKCINCPIEYTEFCERLIYSYVADDFEPEIFQEEIIDKIQKWNDEHPQKTYADDFFEKFPSAMKYENMYPRGCRQHIYGGECPDGIGCFSCWNEPMEE